MRPAILCALQVACRCAAVERNMRASLWETAGECHFLREQ